MQRVEHRYRPRGNAAKVFRDKSDEIVLSGPAGTGKSRGLLEKMHAMAMLNPNMAGLLTRRVGAALAAAGLRTYENYVAKEALASGEVTFFGGSTRLPPAYRYSNGASLAIGGLDKPEKIMSTEYDCLIGETLVDSPSAVQRCYSRPYSGQLVTITTAGGNQLTGTPNHPILTTRGWVGLGALREGDHVLSRVPGQPLSAHADPHVTQQPTPIAEVAGALAQADGGRGRAERLKTVPMNFHGDGAHGYVDVVTAGSLLQDGRPAEFVDPIAQSDGGRAEFQQAALMGNGSGVERLRGLGPVRLALAGAAELAHAVAVRFGASPGVGSARPRGGEVGPPFGVDAHPGLPLGERVGGGAPSDAAGGHLALEARHADADRGGDVGQSCLAGEIAPDRVVNVSVADAGRGRHVYNLQTETSWYYANGVVSHNCVYVQEATELDESTWEIITGRLRNGRVSFQQILADCNPSHPLHWLKLRAERGAVKMYETVHEDNPVYFDEIRGPDGLIEYKITRAGKAYLDKLDRLTGVRYLRLRKGLWVAAEGVIYEEFDPFHHVIDPFEIPDSWDRVWGIDFGHQNPFVLQRWAVDPDGRMYLYREHYGTRRLVEDWARIVLDDVSDPDPNAPDDLDRRIWREPKPKAILADHDAEGRATFERHSGLRTRPAVKGVATGIEWMQARFRRQADGKARVYFLRDCRVMKDQELVDARKPTCTVEELPAYIWDRGLVRVEGANQPTLKETPLKRDDHGMDTMRYVGAHLGVPLRLELADPTGGTGSGRMPVATPYG